MVVHSKQRLLVHNREHCEICFEYYRAVWYLDRLRVHLGPDESEVVVWSRHICIPVQLAKVKDLENMKTDPRPQNLAAGVVEVSESEIVPTFHVHV